jgi:hypothetical protein
MVIANPRLSTKEYARRLKVGSSSVKRTFKKLKMVKRRDELVPYDLSESQKLCRVQRSEELLQLSEPRGYLDRIITCDKKMDTV